MRLYIYFRSKAIETDRGMLGKCVLRLGKSQGICTWSGKFEVSA